MLFVFYLSGDDRMIHTDYIFGNILRDALRVFSNDNSPIAIGQSTFSSLSESSLTFCRLEANYVTTPFFLASDKNQAIQHSHFVPLASWAIMNISK